MKITIAPYDPNWPEQFRQEQTRLTQRLASLAPRIKHIGSTSVPGLAAKPVIDIAVGLRSAADLDLVADLMLGDAHYLYFPLYESSMPDRRFFLRIESEEQLAQLPQVITERKWSTHPALLTRQYHIHIWQDGTEEFLRHLRFRDHLRSHPEVRQAYEDLKIRLSQQEWDSGNDYAEAKTRFIRRIEGLAAGNENV